MTAREFQMGPAVGPSIAGKTFGVGLLLPHFGAAWSPARIIEGAKLAEEFGMDSLWARDHLIWEPHGMEGTDRSFIDPFVTLAACAAVTNSIHLATGVVIPIRWPLKLAQNFASLSALSDGRAVPGIGLGFDPREFAGAGLSFDDREEILVETIEICRQAWTSGYVEYSGKVFSVDGVALAPLPKQKMPVIYGGSTNAAIRRSIAYGDGWHSGRLPIDTLVARLEYLERHKEAVGDSRDIITIAQPLVVLAETREEAAALVPVEQMAASSAGAKNWVKPSSGEFSTLEDLRGLVVCGNTDDVLEGLMEFKELGVTDLVLDLRLQHDRFLEVLQELGEVILPQLNADIGTSSVANR